MSAAMIDAATGRLEGSGTVPGSKPEAELSVTPAGADRDTLIGSIKSADQVCDPLVKN
jgi:hypothetical protein